MGSSGQKGKSSLKRACVSDEKSRENLDDVKDGFILKTRKCNISYSLERGEKKRKKKLTEIRGGSIKAGKKELGSERKAN